MTIISQDPTYMSMGDTYPCPYSRLRDIYHMPFTKKTYISRARDV